MKRILLIICVSVLSMTSASAQLSDRSVEATDIRLTRANGQVEVSFTLRAGEKVTKPSYNLVVDPLVRNGASQRQLPAIVIRGKRSKVIDLRHGMGRGAAADERRYMAPGEVLEYVAKIPYEDWMRGGELTFEGVSVGCCSSTEVALGLVADNILDGGDRVETKVVATPISVRQPTTGQRLAERYPFVAPASEFQLDHNGEMSQRVIAQIRQGSVSIFFDQGRRVVDSSFGDNNRNLVELVAAVRALAAAQDSRIAAIVIAGFASPEGSVGLNNRLAWDRAIAVRDFLVRNTELDPRAVRIYNGGVDWAGLRELIRQSDLYWKEPMIRIIDNTPVWDSGRNAGRRGELMRLDGGAPWRYISREFFPKLRQAAYIKVYYEDK